MQNKHPLSAAATTGIVIVVMVSCCLTIFICLLAAGAGWYVLQRRGIPFIMPGPATGSTPDGTRVGDKALDFNLTDLDGHPLSLSEYRGQAVLLNFWATWCDYCMEEFPMIQTYQELYSGQLVVLAVEQGSPVSEVEEFVLLNLYPFIFLPDRNYAVGDAYGVIVIPATYFIDPEGIIRKVYEGLMGQEVIEDGLHAIGLE